MKKNYDEFKKDRAYYKRRKSEPENICKKKLQWVQDKIDEFEVEMKESFEVIEQAMIEK